MIVRIKRESKKATKRVWEHFWFPRVTESIETKIYTTFLGVRVKLRYHYLLLDTTTEIREFILPWDDTCQTMQICRHGKLIGYRKIFIDAFNDKNYQVL